ncbi:hypothetical protein [Tolypothrix bouteillei]|uniref:hypothetical protein n=1 Tax=Tolypothrix bouteillei TaxID=1246981 RepID=UPI000A42C94F|nr:hypothetical protein [Tolypothrix bouteillei]
MNPQNPNLNLRSTYLSAILLTETQYQAIKICATKKGMSIKELMISFIEQELEN